jgi:hypothetical protein
MSMSVENFLFRKSVGKVENFINLFRQFFVPALNDSQ